MRYRVNPLLSGSLLILLLGVYAYAAAQSTQCDCATPPGGSVTCEKGQVPICIVKNGKVISICKSPPETRKTVAQQNAWILSIILEKEVTEEDLRLKPEYQGFLRKGQLNTNDMQVMFVGFKPPAESLPQRMHRRGPVWARRNNDNRPTRQELSDHHYDRAEAMVKRGNYREASTEFRKALEIEPRADAYLGLGISLYNAGSVKDAEAAYRRGLQLDPRAAELYVALGAIYYEQDKFSEAEASLKRAVSLDSDLADAYEALGSVLYAQLKFADAEAAFRRGAWLRPDSATLYTKLGDALYAQQKVAEAEASYAKAKILGGPGQVERNQ